MTPERTIITCPRRLVTVEDANEFVHRIKLHEPREGNIILDGAPLDACSVECIRRLIAGLGAIFRRRGVIPTGWPLGATMEMRRLWDLGGHIVLEQAFRLNESSARKEIDFTGKKLPPPARSRRQKGGAA